MAVAIFVIEKQRYLVSGVAPVEVARSAIRYPFAYTTRSPFTTATDKPGTPSAHIFSSTNAANVSESTR